MDETLGSAEGSATEADLLDCAGRLPGHTPRGGSALPPRVIAEGRRNERDTTMKHRLSDLNLYATPKAEQKAAALRE